MKTTRKEYWRVDILTQTKPEADPQWSTVETYPKKSEAMTDAKLWIDGGIYKLPTPARAVHVIETIHEFQPNSSNKP